MKPDPLSLLPDYPAIRQVQDALWGAGEVRGAAVMIGAGLSKAALRAAEDTRSPPLWPDFSRAMSERLQNLDPHRDPLKIADEYEAALGRHALDALIRDQVRDTHWRPGPLHERLLGLPWADVLTTNWDTLLERTPLTDPDRRYEVVHVPADIARTRAPRIVKLHGSMPSHTPFIFTGEDFRTYPRRFAAFVNLAQEVLLENELCLVGFSGDDPNFLQWSGWVRDQLGVSARRIRLVGVLNLTPSRRRVLEQQNISPIDLAPAVASIPQGEKHLVALGLFLESLWAARPRAPYVWQRSRLKETDIPTGGGDETLRIIEASWKSDREAYPGWAVAPSSLRIRLRHETSAVWSRFKSAFDLAEPANRASALVELVWRYDTAFWPYDKWLFDTTGSVLAHEDAKLRPVDRATLLTSRTRAARLDDRETEFRAGLLELDELGFTSAAALERALWAKDHLDLAGVEAELAAIDGDDPLWGLRRAAMLACLHRPKDAARTIQNVLANIRVRRAQDPRSIWLLSREAWATFLGRMSIFHLRDEVDLPAADPDEGDDPPSRYQAARCEPWDEFTEFDRSLHEARDFDGGPDTIRHFDPGVYVRTPGERYISHVRTEPLDHLLWLAERIGLPGRLGNFSLLDPRIEQAYASIEGEKSDGQVWRAAASLRSYDKGLINQVFNRVAIAGYDENVVVGLFDAVRKAIEFGLPQLEGDNGHEWVDAIRDWLQLASRLVVRLSPDAAKVALQWGLRLSTDPRVTHWWLFESLNDFLARSYAAIPPQDRSAFGLDLLKFPLSSEKEFEGSERDWPEPGRWVPQITLQRPIGDTTWTLRIGELLQRAKGYQLEARYSALLRLSLLNDANGLTPSEQEAFAAALWRDAPVEKLPIDTNFRSFAILRLPETHPGRAATAFSTNVVAPLLQGQFTDSNLHSLSVAAFRGECGLSVGEAKQLLDKLLQWKRPPPSQHDFFGQDASRKRGIAEQVGLVAAKAALPSLTTDDLAPELGDRLIQQIVATELPSWLQASAQAIRLMPSREAEVVAALRRAIARGDNDVLRHAVDAVQEFLGKQGDSMPPAVLVSDIVSACAIRRDVGLNWLLPAAQAFVEADLLSEEELIRLSQALAFLLAETEYKTWRPSDPRTSSLSLIRRHCVRLAKALKAHGVVENAVSDWLVRGAADPLPEVRYA